MKTNLETLTGYENKVVDLSRRNRLLKFPKKAKAIDFDMSIQEFQDKFGTLDDLTIEFFHKQILEEEAAQGVENVEEESSLQVYIPPTKPSGEKLITLLNGLRLETRRKFEEHGLHTLFLSVGKVKWREPSLGKKNSANAVDEFDYNAPLLLIPIHIEEKKNPKKTTISTYLETGDISTNMVLSLLLQKEYNSRPITLNQEMLADLRSVMDDLFSQVTEIFKELKLTFELSEEIQIGQYSFFGQQIYEDLNKNEKAIIENEFINALCTHSQLQQENLDIEVDNPDALLTLENDYNVMDADTSQLEVIQKVLQENHLNVQGPPGTGKSQTIVNLISNLLARKKSVLVVCEKQVALEVVLERLKSTGLDKLCLPLFHYNADNKIFAKSVITDRDNVIRMDASIKNGTNLNTPLTQREKKIERLRTYANALGQVVEPLGKSLFWVHGELVKYKDSSSDPVVPWNGNDALQVTHDDYRNLLSILESIAPVYNIATDERHAHWQFIKKQHFSPDFVSRVNQILASTVSLLPEMEQVKLDAATPLSVSDVRKLVGLTSTIADVQPINSPFNTEANLQKVTTLLVTALQFVEEYQALKNSFPNKYTLPLKWNHCLIEVTDDFITEDVKISQIKNALLEGQVLNDKLKFITDSTKGFHNSSLVTGTQIDELLSYKILLSVDPAIKHVNNWYKLSSLEALAEQLNNLHSIYTRLSDVKKSFTKWAIVSTELSADEVLSIGERFETKYGSFFRYFYSQYKKDCKTIAAWCNGDTPKKHQGYAEVAGAVRDWFKLQGKIKVLLDNFNSENVESDKAIEASQIPNIFFSVKNIVEWLNTESVEELPEKVVQILSDNTSSLILKDLYSAVADIQKIFDTTWNIFQSEEINKGLTIHAITKLYPLLHSSMENTLALYEAVHAVHPDKIYDCTTGVLRLDATQVEKLFSQIEKIQQLKLDNLFEGSNVVPDILNAPDEFREFVTNINNIGSVVSALSDLLPTKMSVAAALGCIHELRQNLPKFEAWTERYNKGVTELNRLFENEQSIQHLEGLEYREFADKIKIMTSDEAGLEKWMLYRRYAYQLEQLGQDWFLRDTVGLSVMNPVTVFAQALWSAWLDAHYKSTPILRDFNVKDHEKIIAEFQTLEQQVLKVNAYRILQGIAPELKNAKRFGGDADKELVHQSQLKQRHKPIRRLVKESGQQLLRYKPCWMMSPLTLSSYIPYGLLNFDVVIFDEASQMRVEHALGAIARAKQVVIFGDENQLPPTSFFDVSTGEEEDEEVTEDYESILHATKEILPGADELLSYHYRSKYEDLIAFSNHYVYDDQLVTFPNPNKAYRAVQFEYVQKGVFDGGKDGSRRNDIEAAKVIEMCVKQATEEPEKSLGVIAFSRSQEAAIRDALIGFLKKNPQFQSKLDEDSDSSEPFFIKNLESVQGDERDVIILSVGYGKDKKTGEVYNRFGPINSQHGYRRLNVAVTRAKEKVICVSSIKSSDIRNAEKSRGAFMLQKYLEYAERGMEALDASRLVQNNEGIEADSPFEEEVEKALQDRGYSVHRQVGVSGFKIDLAIVDPENGEEYILAVECDGASYHSSYSARMNDRIRQEILERLGWKIYRIWSQHWISHKEAIIDDIVSSIASI